MNHPSTQPLLRTDGKRPTCRPPLGFFSLSRDNLGVPWLAKSGTSRPIGHGTELRVARTFAPRAGSKRLDRSLAGPFRSAVFLRDHKKSSAKYGVQRTRKDKPRYARGVEVWPTTSHDRPGLTARIRSTMNGYTQSSSKRVLGIRLPWKSYSTTSGSTRGLAPNELTPGSGQALPVLPRNATLGRGYGEPGVVGRSG